ncbi:hypothetical protein JH25_03670 [Pseudomonas sp. BRG-100]|nr:hypothetical protein JH25_03670 [Pseudomonas sp. BRG-100]
MGVPFSKICMARPEVVVVDCSGFSVDVVFAGKKASVIVYFTIMAVTPAPQFKPMVKAVSPAVDPAFSKSRVVTMGSFTIAGVFNWQVGYFILMVVLLAVIFPQP